MRLQDVMTEQLRTISPTASADDAWNVMRLHGIHHLVVTKGGRAIGILSDRDTGSRRGAAVRATKTVGELMTAPAVTAAPTMTIRQAANVMRGRSIGCLVVLESGRPVGIVTVSDLLEVLGRGLDRGAATNARRTLNHRVPHKKVHAAVRAW
jgi:signal-transduction protein with cAMP-binding, CBS, and nucleotidyltransferase domain